MESSNGMMMELLERAALALVCRVFVKEVGLKLGNTVDEPIVSG